MAKVEVINQHRSFKISGPFVKKIAGRILKSIGNEEGVELEIIFLDDASIIELNSRYKKEDSPTDVLSFMIDRAEFGEESSLGEIFISLDAARRNSIEFGAAFEEEIVLYIIHGILHLFGYDDTTAAKKRRMSARQSGILKRLCGKETLSRVLTRR
jgi:probable rRNA maturation factor